MCMYVHRFNEYIHKALQPPTSARTYGDYTAKRFLFFFIFLFSIKKKTINQNALLDHVRSTSRLVYRIFLRVVALMMFYSFTIVARITI